MSNTRFLKELEKQKTCEIIEVDYIKEFAILEATMLNLKHLKQSKLFSHEKFIQIIYVRISFNQLV